MANLFDVLQRIEEKQDGFSELQKKHSEILDAHHKRSMHLEAELAPIKAHVAAWAIAGKIVAGLLAGGLAVAGLAKYLL